MEMTIVLCKWWKVSGPEWLFNDWIKSSVIISNVLCHLGAETAQIWALNVIKTKGLTIKNRASAFFIDG